MAFIFVYLWRKDGVHTKMLGAGRLGEYGYSYEDPYIAAAVHRPQNVKTKRFRGHQRKKDSRKDKMKTPPTHYKNQNQIDNVTIKERMINWMIFSGKQATKISPDFHFPNHFLDPRGLIRLYSVGVAIGRGLGSWVSPDIR